LDRAGRPCDGEERMTDPPSSSAASVAADPVDFRRCARCNYPLRGLPAGRSCPECGATAVACPKPGLETLPRSWRIRALWAVALMVLWSAIRLGWWLLLMKDVINHRWRGCFPAANALSDESYQYLGLACTATLAAAAATATMLLLMGCPRLLSRTSVEIAGRKAAIAIVCLTLAFTLALFVPPVNRAVTQWMGEAWGWTIFRPIFVACATAMPIIGLLVLSILAKRKTAGWLWLVTLAAWLLWVFHGLLAVRLVLLNVLPAGDALIERTYLAAVVGLLVTSIFWFRALWESLHADE
jgi:hypothetical protein